MKKIITVVLFALAFTTSANAQETKKDCEVICCKENDKDCTAEEKAKCKDMGITCATTDKSRTASNDKKGCTTSSSCCASGKAPAKKA